MVLSPHAQVRAPTCSNHPQLEKLSGGVKMANDAMLPENNDRCMCETYPCADMARNSVACLVQGGGTPYGGKDKEQLWVESARVARKPDNWKPSMHEERADQATCWWDWRIKASLGLCGVGPVEVSPGAQMVLQWAPRRGSTTKEVAREQGVDCCSRAIPGGVPCRRAHPSKICCVCAMRAGMPFQRAHARTYRHCAHPAVREEVDRIVGVGATEWLIRTHLCWGHVQVICQLPPPPNDLEELEESATSEKARLWWEAMQLIMLWNDIEGTPLEASGAPLKAWDRFKWQAWMAKVARQEVTLPPIMLAQVRWVLGLGGAYLVLRTRVCHRPLHACPVW